MKKDYLRTLLFLAVFIFGFGSRARADGLFRLFPELQLTGLYSDNIPLRTSNEIGDFAGLGALGFYLDYTSAARYASLHYDTFAQLFAHQSRLDRAGEGQSVSATDDENLSQTTKLHLDEFFFRDSPGQIAVTIGSQAPQFNTVMALLLLANDQAAVNQVNAQLFHDWGHRLSTELHVNQTTFWYTGSSSVASSTSFAQRIGTVTDYHFNGRFSLGLGYRFYDFRFTLPGRPGEIVNWPYARVQWQPLENLYLQGIMGVAISHTQGTNGDSTTPAGVGLAEYHFHHGQAKVFGGQEPSLTSAFGTVGTIQYVAGSVLYDFTPRVTGQAGAGYYNSSGNLFSGKFVSWGVGVSDRVNSWLSVNTRFIQVRREETASNQFLPSGTTSGQWATGDYYVVGLAVSFEAFRWSWQ
jgi:hypothetical protein